jgi:hypothetical protein
VQVWIIGLPVLKLLDDNPKATFFVKVGIVFITCMSSLLLLFIPKTRFLRESLIEQKEGLSKSIRFSTNTDGRESVTSHDPSHMSDESPTKFHNNVAGIAMGNVRFAGLDPPSASTGTKAATHARARSSFCMEGIRIIQSSSRHSEEVERLQKSLGRAETRNKVLNNRLERLQGKMEQYIVAHHPHDSQRGAYALLQTRPEQRISGATEESPSNS